MALGWGLFLLRRTELGLDIQQLTLAIRPRPAWEAVDVGCLLAQRQHLDLLRLWFAITLPWLGLLLLLAPPWAVPLLMWWAKPAYDRALLLVLGRGVFGERLRLGLALGLLPGLWWRSGLLWSLTLGRFSPTRAYDLPLVVLEGAHGKAYRARRRLLHGDGSGAATWLTVIGAHLEGMLGIAGIILMIWLLPANIELEFTDFFAAETSSTIDYLFILPSYVAMTLVEPFYVAAGFSLYLNRRTWLEGWDLELAFRRLATRLGLALLLVGLSLTSLGLSGTLSPAYAMDARVLPPETECAPRPEPRNAVERALSDVLAQPEFKACEPERYWRWLEPKAEVTRKTPQKTLPWDNLIRALATAMEWTLWGLLGLALAILGVYLLRWLKWLDWQTVVTRRTLPPEQLMGLDIRPEQLPTDVPAVAWQLWQAGEAEAALSLLYRGALATLVQRAVPLEGSATEGDCLTQVTRHQPQPVSRFFAELTHAWLLTAYAHRPPATPQVQQLCQQWPQHFAA